MSGRRWPAVNALSTDEGAAWERAAPGLGRINRVLVLP